MRERERRETAFVQPFRPSHVEPWPQRVDAKMLLPFFPTRQLHENEWRQKRKSEICLKNKTIKYTHVGISDSIWPLSSEKCTQHTHTHTHSFLFNENEFIFCWWFQRRLDCVLIIFLSLSFSHCTSSCGLSCVVWITATSGPWPRVRKIQRVAEWKKKHGIFLIFHLVQTRFSLASTFLCCWQIESLLQPRTDQVCWSDLPNSKYS